MTQHLVVLCFTFMFVSGQTMKLSVVEPASLGDVPYAVVLLLGGYTCSGALIHPTWVLTAAHCMHHLQQRNITIQAGTLHRSQSLSGQTPYNSPVQTTSSVAVFIHPLYNSTWASHDIALIKLLTKLNNTKYIRPVPLSMKPWGNSSQLCKVSGFGRLQKNTSSSLDGQLKTHSLQITRPCPCESQLSKEKGYERVVNWLCSELEQHSGPCKGDSGAPLVCDGELRGITSSTFYVYDPASCDLSQEPSIPQCGTPHELYIFMDTYPHLSWLQDVLLTATSGSRPRHTTASNLMLDAVIFASLLLSFELICLAILTGSSNVNAPGITDVRITYVQLYR